MSDRLDDLKRQRQLVHQHLQWLDREIERQGGLRPAASDAGTRLQPSRAPLAISSPPPDAPEGTAADVILNQFGSVPENLQADTRKGCLTLFFLGLGLLFCGFGIAYYVYATRPSGAEEKPPAIEQPKLAPLPQR